MHSHDTFVGNQQLTYNIIAVLVFHHALEWVWPVATRSCKFGMDCSPFLGCAVFDALLDNIGGKLMLG